MTRFSYEPERIADDLFAIPLPLHDGSPVNTYVALADGGAWLIDGGLATEHCQTTLLDGLRSLGYALGDVRGLVVTHGHNDHVGAGFAMAQQGGEILAHRLEATDGRRLAFEPDWLRRNGLPLDRIDDSRWRPVDWPAPTRLLEDGDVFRWGSLNLQVVWCPGHTRGLICLYEPARRLLFTTDHVMRRAPAPVSVRMDSNEDPLGDYLASVARLKSLAVQTVLPGHGRPFGGLPRRLSEIEGDILAQLDAVRQRLGNCPATGYELLASKAMPDRRPIAERYALSQLLARVRHLEHLGQVQRLPATREGLIRYALAERSDYASAS